MKIRVMEVGPDGFAPPAFRVHASQVVGLPTAALDEAAVLDLIYGPMVQRSLGIVEQRPTDLQEGDLWFEVEG
ncbi:MAG: hypothetical protein QM708_12025 [Propioniciclava sp.]|uniref:hypothetical protein n=1 Tax=Propioniciclava sp. TaxID=2038686 RepID=UPI0039E70E62